MPAAAVGGGVGRPSATADFEAGGADRGRGTKLRRSRRCWSRSSSKAACTVRSAWAADGTIDQHADLDLAGRDHLDVDPGLGQGLEHRRGDAGVGLASPGRRPRPWRRSASCVTPAPRRPSRPPRPTSERLGQVAGGDGEADLGRRRRCATFWTIMSTTMFASAIGRNREWTTPGRSGTPRIVIRASSLASAAPVTLTPSRRASLLGDDPGPRGVGERAADVDRHAVLLGELDRARVHHARAEAGQFEHLVVADPVDLAGLGHDPGVGRVDAVDVGVDLAGVGSEHGGQGHGGRVRAAAAQRRDVVRSRRPPGSRRR